MKYNFDIVSNRCTVITTKQYSTSFSLAVKMLAPRIRPHIYNIYGFVRLADEIVDSFHEYDKYSLFKRLEEDLQQALTQKISINPILNAFQHTALKFNITERLITSFMKSMHQDLHKKNYHTYDEYKTYIYGSADVVGLMCLKVFVQGDAQRYLELKEYAMALGSAFQKVNFLRDINTDFKDLNRSYFPNVDLNNLTEEAKNTIIAEIESDFKKAYRGIIQLPVEAKFGVFVAYKYYTRLLHKLKKASPSKIKHRRIRVPHYEKIILFLRTWIHFKLNFKLTL